MRQKKKVDRTLDLSQISHVVQSRIQEITEIKRTHKEHAKKKIVYRNNEVRKLWFRTGSRPMIAGTEAARLQM
jgi:hypothetical protein